MIILKSLVAAAILVVSMMHFQIDRELLNDSKGEPHWYQQGSGFFINRNGYLVTAAHVIEGSDKNNIVIRYMGKPIRVELIAEDVQHDVAILHANIPNTEFFVLGEPIDHEESYIIGFPAESYFGLYTHETHGDTATDKPAEDTFSVFAKSCHGNSGGAVINSQGILTGILVYGFSDGTLLNGLCSNHAGARFTENLRKLASAYHVAYTYNSDRIRLVGTDNLSLTSVDDLIASIIDRNKVVFIQVPVKE